MSGRGNSPPPGGETMELVETMDSTSVEDEAKRLSETTPPPVAQTNTAQVAQDPESADVTDQFLYDNADEIIKIIELKAKLTADWFRPADCQTNPDLARHYDQMYDDHSKEMEARCAKLHISQNAVPVTINELKDRVEYLHMAKQATATPSANPAQANPKPTSAKPRRGTEKRPLDADGFRQPPKHLIRGTTANAIPTPTLPTTLPSGCKSLELEFTERKFNPTQQKSFCIPTPAVIPKMSTRTQSSPLTATSYSDILMNRKQTETAQSKQHQTSYPMSEQNSTGSASVISTSALELFRTLAHFAHDTTINFPVLLQAIRLALPTLRTLQSDEEKTLLIFEFYHATLCA
ncbi:hypothetical protein CDAR_591721 [Caerostris darwini]|uniref:Uncharacterized protein n=1 Tax=Caerostris darwini TaxID=1538125 RepID=A0AAV4PLK7_9ARAC|nr:hypothetical protein CDAR_591721 [Caerostris darwini]